MDFTRKYIIIAMVVLNIVSHGESSVKIWKYDNDVQNPSNWQDGKVQDKCDGLNLSQNNGEIIKLDNLNVKKIILPLNARLTLTDGVIEFNEHSTDIMNCVRTKRQTIVNYWANPDSWIIQDNDANVAIPHYERVPCRYDDVIFPKGFKSSYCLLWNKVEVKSIKFGNDYLKYEDFKNDKNLGEQVFAASLHDMIHISGNACTDPTGCVCREDLTIDYQVCEDVYDTTFLNCLEPIKPIGFCSEICGASLLFKPKSDFQIAKVRKSLKYYSSDTYVSKVRNGSVVVIQINFAEKEFSGSSLDEARDYFAQILADETVQAKSVEMYLSGPLFIEGEATRNAFSIVFGSLCGVLFVFAILFIIYSPRFTALNFGNRFFLSSTSLSSFKSNLFARYDNTENAELILERRSSAGSITNLEKSFENPMFGKSTPSTASASYGTIYTPEDRSTKSEISLENPLYEIHNLDETVLEAAEENFVDLIQKEE